MKKTITVNINDFMEKVSKVNADITNDMLENDFPSNMVVQETMLMAMFSAKITKELFADDETEDKGDDK